MAIGIKKMDKIQRTFIIAEIGCNNNGDISRAEIMAESAKKCGANAVKFQTFWDLGCLKEYEMKKTEWRELAEVCEIIGIEFMSTPHWGSPLCGYKDEDYKVIDFIDKFVKRHKVASPYLTNEKYLKYIADKGKPLIISTGSIIHKNGMATMKEIETALKWVGDKDITLLHCVSKYPCSEAHLERIEELKQFKYPVGISDHTTSITPPNVPMVEKHFKIDENCIDANVSLNIIDFKKYVKNLRGKFFSE